MKPLKPAPTSDALPILAADRFFSRDCTVEGAASPLPPFLNSMPNFLDSLFPDLAGREPAKGERQGFKYQAARHAKRGGGDTVSKTQGCEMRFSTLLLDVTSILLHKWGLEGEPMTFYPLACCITQSRHSSALNEVRRSRVGRKNIRVCPDHAAEGICCQAWQ